MLVSIQLTDHGERHVDSIVKVRETKIELFSEVLISQRGFYSIPRNLFNISLVLLSKRIFKYSVIQENIFQNVFQYISMMKKNLPSERYYKELSVLTEQRFEMKEREKAITTAEQLSHSLSCYQPSDLLTGDWLVTEYNPNLIMTVLADLHPDNLRLTVLSKNAKYLETVVEPHYGTEYHVDRIAEESLAQWRNTAQNSAFFLPPANPLISSLQPTLTNPARTFRQPELFCLLDRIRNTLIPTLTLGRAELYTLYHIADYQK